MKTKRVASSISGSIIGFAAWGTLLAAEDAPARDPTRMLLSPADECTEPAPPFTLGGDDWNGWGIDEVNSRHQASPGLVPDEVPRLRLKWAFSYQQGTVFSQPTVVGGRVFVQSIPGDVYSLDARTGCTYWSYATGAGGRATISIGPVPESLAPARFAAYVAANDGVVHALDAETGEPIWTTRVEDHPAVLLTGSPKLYEDRLYVPVSSSEEARGANAQYECCTFRGSLVALDALSGEVLWKSYTINETPRPVRVSTAGTQLHGPAGGAIWMSPTIDVVRGRLYVGTGNSYTDIPEEGSDAILAFDLETGEIAWRRQITPNDAHVMGCYTVQHANCPAEVGPDSDFGASPILRTLPDGRELLLVGQKSGVIWALDPARDGEVVWNARLGSGGALGGIQWGPAADEEVVYVAVSDASYVADQDDVSLRSGQRRPGLTALRIATGEQVWHTPAPPPECSWGREGGCGNGQSAAVTLIPGMVFSGSLDGRLRGYSARDGSIVWDVDTAAEFDAVNGHLARGGSLDATGPTVAAGMLFVNSGYGRWGYPGNVLLAFSVDGR